MAQEKNPTLALNLDKTSFYPSYYVTVKSVHKPFPLLCYMFPLTSQIKSQVEGMASSREMLKGWPPVVKLSLKSILSSGF